MNIIVEDHFYKVKGNRKIKKKLVITAPVEEIISAKRKSALVSGKEDNIAKGYRESERIMDSDDVNNETTIKNGFKKFSKAIQKASCTFKSLEENQRTNNLSQIDFSSSSSDNEFHDAVSSSPSEFADQEDSSVPDIVTSTTRNPVLRHSSSVREKKFNDAPNEVDLVIMLCKNYQQIIQILKEENRNLAALYRSQISSAPHDIRMASMGSARKEKVSECTTFADDCSATSISIFPLVHSRSCGVIPQKCLENFNSSGNALISGQRKVSSVNVGLIETYPLQLKKKSFRDNSFPRKLGSMRRPSVSNCLVSTEIKQLNLKSSQEICSSTNSESIRPLKSHKKILRLEEEIKRIMSSDAVQVLFNQSAKDSRFSRALSCSRKEVKKQRDSHHHSNAKLKNNKEFSGMDDDSEEELTNGAKCHCTQGTGCQYQILAQASHIEADRLRQFVQLLNTRLTESSDTLIKTEERLKAERHKTALLEHAIERKSLLYGPDNSFSCEAASLTNSLKNEVFAGANSSREIKTSKLTPTDSDSLFNDKLSLAKEEIQLLRQHIEALQHMREDDLKIYESTVDHMKQTISSDSPW